MSIFKGIGLYKTGANDGGMKDGGSLVDGDFILVPNNAISSYTNNSRANLNFYFDTKPGEPANAAIEVVNDVNSTVNVYVPNADGELVPLGNIGGDTLTASEHYIITIIGNSFVIEQVTEPVSPDPVAVIIEGSIYGVKKAGNRIWSTEDIKIPLSGAKIRSGLTYYTWNHIQAILGKLPSGWRVANESDWYDLQYNSGWNTAQLKSVSGWIEYGGRGPYPGTNASGLNFLPRGSLNAGNASPYQIGWNGYYWCTTGNNSAYFIGCDNYGHKQGWISWNKSDWLGIRICKTA